MWYRLFLLGVLFLVGCTSTTVDSVDVVLTGSGGGTFVMVTNSSSLTVAEQSFADLLMNNSIYNFTSYQVADSAWTNHTSYTPDLFVISQNAVGSEIRDNFKLKNVSYGVMVNSYSTTLTALEYCSSSGVSQATAVNVVNNTHPATNWTTTGSKTYFDASQRTNYYRCQGGLAASAVDLAQHTTTSSYSIYSAYDEGSTMLNSFTAPARRSMHGVHINEIVDWSDWQKNMTVHLAVWTSNITITEEEEPEDTCTYVSGNHLYECSDNCVLTEDLAVDSGAVITINGTGTFTGLRYVKGAQTIRLMDGCNAKT